MNSPLPSLASRVRARSPRALDAALVGLLVAVSAVEVSLADASAGARGAAALPVALAAAGLLVRRRDHIAGAVLVSIGVLSTDLLAEPVWDSLSAIYIALIAAVYLMAAHETGRRLRIGIALTVVLNLAVSLTTADRGPDDSSPVATFGLGLAFFVVAPVFAGRLLHSRLRLSAALGEKAQRLEDERAGQARDAVTSERTRIAGELHDVVAHALGAMTVQAAAARRLAAVKPERAGGAFEAIETTGREALGELRTLLDALRDEDDAPATLQPPKPSLTALTELAARASAAGLEVTLEIDGTRPEALPAGIDLTAYRLVQEALEAALHDGGAGAARVIVRYRGDRLDVEVVDDGLRVANRRLLGLRERVALFGGQIDARAERAGGHAVRAWLPLEGVAA